ncbi:hypothetical protein C8D87_10644 [Lentzea atacamensis]|uniref:DUF397 domain-containing protein n=1 Tax=Lentzea atacamensis TaxID=531938 RepID=A0ABX9E3L1_9PSEU|nr:hypothetical protein C8D87_10644 [Lentzea atacamensis]
MSRESAPILVHSEDTKGNRYVGFRSTALTQRFSDSTQNGCSSVA